VCWRSWGQGQPIIFLHGGYGSWAHWIKQALPFSKTNKVLIPDMPGFGDSDDLDLPHTPEKIASNILTNRLKSLLEMGLIEKLDPEGTKKSTTYIATLKGMDSLPIICQMYLFSIDTIDETLLDDTQRNIKKQIKGDLALFQKTKIAEYESFIEDLRANLKLSKVALKK
jgi:pimeloyl-ACP methyl ester carboxylesterase